MPTLEEVLASYPTLNMCGIIRSETPPAPVRPDVVVAVVESLANVPKAKGFGPHSSYLYKHIAEKGLGRYVSNGEFIAAALVAGFRIKRYPGSLNVDLNISKTAARTYNAAMGSPRNLL